MDGQDNENMKDDIPPTFIFCSDPSPESTPQSYTAQNSIVPYLSSLSLNKTSSVKVEDMDCDQKCGSPNVTLDELHKEQELSWDDCLTPDVIAAMNEEQNPEILQRNLLEDIRRQKVLELLEDPDIVSLLTSAKSKETEEMQNSIGQ